MIESDSIATVVRSEVLLFGESSRLIESSERVERLTRGISMNEELSYEITVILLVILYLIWIGRSLSNLDGLSFKVANPFAPISESEGLKGARRMGDMILDWTLVVTTMSLFITRLFDMAQIYHPSMVDMVQRITNLGLWRWMLLVTFAAAVVMLWGALITIVGSSIIRRKKMSRGLIMLKSRLLRMSTVWLMPPVIMSALEGDNFGVTYIAITVAITFAAIYLFRTFLLFNAQKISILHWILYLCTVEIFPLTLLWALFVR